MRKSRRILHEHPAAVLVGIDESGLMIAAAVEALSDRQVDLRVARLEDPLPDGPFDLVVNALSVHHLDGPAKVDLFARVAERLRSGGRFVLGDVIVPVDPEDALTPLEKTHDKPSSAAEQLTWLAASGFDARIEWQHHDLVVLVADLAP